MIEHKIDYDIHGFLGVRLINPSESDASAVAKQLGPMQKTLTAEPDIIVRFVDHLPLGKLNYLGLEKVGYNEEAFFILKSSKKDAKVQLAFDEIGERFEILCESGLKSVPLLLAIINLSLLKKNVVALHASAFVYNGKGIMVTGWAKGGKTEALLSFSDKGAEYVGDEWIFLSSDGKRMYGIPENIRLWDWHLDNLPRLKAKLSREKNLLFKGIHLLDKSQNLGKKRLGRVFPLKYLREAMPALKRQLNVQLPPQEVFDKCNESFSARFDKIFLLLSHNDSAYIVERTNPAEIADRMLASNQYELIPFMENYMAYKFAFPKKQNKFIEKVPQIQSKLLLQALLGKDAYTVRHPYPLSFDKLFEVMEPYCCEERIEDVKENRNNVRKYEEVV